MTPTYVSVNREGLYSVLSFTMSDLMTNKPANVLTKANYLTSTRNLWTHLGSNVVTQTSFV